LENGLVLGDSYDYGATIFHECFPGYNMVGGDASRECLDTGRWSGSSPDCKGTVLECIYQKIMTNYCLIFPPKLILEVTCKIPLIREAHVHHYGSKEDLPESQANCTVGEQIEVCAGDLDKSILDILNLSVCGYFMQNVFLILII
jgi:Sushi repeat (SCR repeat)